MNAPVFLKAKPGYTVVQLIKKLTDMVEKEPEWGHLPVAVEQPAPLGAPFQRSGVYLAGEGKVIIASDGRKMLMIRPNMNEAPISGGNNDKN